MARSHREIFSFVVGFIVLYVGAVVTTNCDGPSVSAVVPFCSNMEVSGRTVYLSGIDNRTNGIGCNCSISLIQYKQDPVDIKIKNVTTSSNPCDYSVYSVYRNTSTRLYSCGEQLHKRSFDFSPTEGLGLYLEPGTYNDVGFQFCLKLLTGVGSDVRLQCRSNSTTKSPAPSTHTSSTNTNISSVTHSATTPQPNNDDSGRMIGIIIGAIIAVLVVVALIIIIICLVKRRKKKPPYETPLEPQDKPHNHVHEAIKPNNYVDSPINHNTQVGSQGMIYLENDHYNSMDNNVPIGPKGGSHGGMIYLENDLYIPSNENDNVHQDAENTVVPHRPVEYAVVNKTAKKGSNGAASGHTVGPHGDEYTLVQKK